MDLENSSFSLEIRRGGVFGILAEQVKRKADAPFVSDRFGSSHSYGELAERARRFASYLRERGVNRGDRVAIHARNRAEIAIALFGAALVGGIYTVLNSKLRPRGLAAILERAEASVIVLDSDTKSNWEQALKESEKLHPDSELRSTTPVVVGEDSWDEAMGCAPVTEDWRACDLDAACLIFTSGSTGVPSGVVLSHDNITFVVAAIQERLRYHEDDTVGVFLPLAFDYGLYQIFLAAQAGASLYIGDTDQVGPRFPAVLAETEVSVLPGVPSIFAALIALSRRGPLHLPALRAVTNTGERLPAAYMEVLERLFPLLQIYPMYGLTECKRVSILLPEEIDTHPGSVGRALEGTEIYVVDEEGRRLSPGEIGELVVRGRNVALGYWRAPEETAHRFRKRAPESAVELFTGDSCSVDEDGYLYFVSRDADWIKHRGHRVGPAEIEAEACRLPEVVEAALIQRQSDDTLHLFVTGDSIPIDPQGVIRQLDTVLEAAKLPDYVHVLEAMPKSINGKIDRKELFMRLRA